MKRAIYLDARDRKLIRDVFQSTIDEINDTLKGALVRSTSMALRYTKTEMFILAERFEEPEPQEDKDQ